MRFWKRRRKVRVFQPVTGNKMGLEMCRALGLDPDDVIGFTLEVRVDCVPNLTVIHYAWDSNVEAFSRTLSKYKLLPRDSD